AATQFGGLLVRVYVRGGPGAGRKDVDWELLVVLAVGDLVAGLGDPLCKVLVELAKLGVRARRRRLDPAQPADHRRRNRLPGDLEVLYRLRGLAAPELIGRLRLHCLGGYLAGGMAGRVAASEGALEAGRKRTAGLAEVSGGVDPSHQVRMDGIRSLAHRTGQVAELQRGRAAGILPGLGV